MVSIVCVHGIVVTMNSNEINMKLIDSTKSYKLDMYEILDFACK